MNKFGVVFALSLATLLSACATSKSGDVYTREQTRQAQTVRMGVVESVRQVQIEGTKRGIGAVAGGLAGAAAEEGLMKTDGVEITVKLDNGNMLAIVQEATEQFHPGERVRILEG